MNVSQAWKILKGECTLPDAFRLTGMSEENITKSMESIKEKDFKGGGCANYFSWSFIISKGAYKFLVKAGEIDGTKVYNLGTKKDGFDETERRFGDMGVMEDKVYRWNGKEWELCY